MDTWLVTRLYVSPPVECAPCCELMTPSAATVGKNFSSFCQAAPPQMRSNLLTGFASAADAFGARDRKFSDNIWNYYLYCRENDIAMTHI